MGNSVAELKYGLYNFDPIPQMGIRESASHIGPTKFGPGFDEKWTKNYKDHAELASKVLYVYIRAILMGMAFEKLGGGSVIALNNKGGATVYPQNKEYKNINNAIKSVKKK